MQRSTQILTPDSAGVDVAADILRRGGLVAFGTETVYGLGADARQGDAVAAIYAAKGRPSFNPLIVHIASLEAAQELARLPDSAQQLAETFWPGPLTLVATLREGHGLSSLVTAGLQTVGLRVPANPAARALLTAFGGPVAAPSANPSGRISPTTAAHVRAGLDGQIDAILDGGPCTVGVESTIVGFDDETPVLLRAGGITAEAIEDVLQRPLANDGGGSITAPGQLASHYAPRGRVRLNARAPEPGEVMLGFGDVAGDMTLSATGDLCEAAARLFDALHQLDASGHAIAVAPIPQHGLGIAINDRLTRAAAPRPAQD
ncbi:L-threonylcarbamoyladenylate synthase [Sulfitobacter sp. S190]|uniref:L-threonylcarbamoyladenylate synthase n=1 Tax=Sulfitobacter sp. S190 TaxID=2867022 RepID=UPI0021A3B91D|nr:L-threonylcarbamoyladenylate synthase [Sulfitobacter sp. S190]UWR23082.1 threonylcarbamoyl-AMP synthase [Sulfitobacter sp. S190]